MDVLILIVVIAFVTGVVIDLWDAKEGVGSPPGPHGALPAGAVGSLRDAHGRSPASHLRQVCREWAGTSSKDVGQPWGQPPAARKVVKSPAIAEDPGSRVTTATKPLVFMGSGTPCPRPDHAPYQVCSDEKIRMLRTAEAIHRAGFPKTRGENPKALLALAQEQLERCWEGR